MQPFIFIIFTLDKLREIRDKTLRSAFSCALIALAVLRRHLNYYGFDRHNSIANMNFQLHPRLEQDCIAVGRFGLSRLLLMNDSQYPWYLLVPEREDVSEIYQLSQVDQLQLQQESCLLSKKLALIYRADKMNIAAIGNMVPQLHVHHIVRYRTDKAWPAPVWGKFDAIPYSKKQIEENVALIREALQSDLID